MLFHSNFFRCQIFPLKIIVQSGERKCCHQGARTSVLIQVLVDFLEERVETHVRLRFLYYLQQLHVFCHNLSEVCHFLEQLGKELGGLGVVQLELQLQGLQQVVLYVLNGLHIQQTWAVWESRNGRQNRRLSYKILWSHSWGIFSQ